MAFAEALKASIRRKAHLRCCLCHELEVEIHHIIPQAAGGTDSEENAAPLCALCHGRYGGNPEKRKFIREARALWFDLCATRYKSEGERLDTISAKLDAVANDVKLLRIRNVAYALGPAEVSQSALPWAELRYSFTRADLIHPLIVKELIGWISDPAPTVVAVDLARSNQSNRFAGVVETREDTDCSWVTSTNETGEYFSYAHIGTSPSGIQMVHCRDGGGGTGIFNNVAVMAFESDRCLENDDTNPFTSAKTRVLLKILGVVALGDRYRGTVRYVGGNLVISPNTGKFAERDQSFQNIPVE